MIRDVLTLAALLTLSASAFAADAVPQPSAGEQSLRQTAGLPPDTTSDQTPRNNAAIPQDRQAEFDAWRADRQSALHYCFDPCIEKSGVLSRGFRPRRAQRRHLRDAFLLPRASRHSRWRAHLRGDIDGADRPMPRILDQHRRAADAVRAGAIVAQEMAALLVAAGSG